MATSVHEVMDFEFREEEQVRAYLDAHPEVVAIIVEARRKLPHFFGEAPAMTLDVLKDPEDPDAESLFALIQTSLEPDRALPLLDEFNERWWRAASTAIEADIHFGLDYVSFI
jgi:hypothetical protein